MSWLVCSSLEVVGVGREGSCARGQSGEVAAVGCCAWPQQHQNCLSAGCSSVFDGGDGH